MLKLAENLTLDPISAGTEKWAFIGRSGSGKSYAASKFIEELYAAKVQVCVVDPVGIHWALRLAADGVNPSAIDIPVLGGQRGDIPLEPSAGDHIADVVADGHSLILDVSEMTLGEQYGFLEHFDLRLLQRKKKNPSALMVVWEECQEFFPQHVSGRTARMVGAGERLVKIGRNYGIGHTFISQRPQAVNKEVLNQTEVLVVFQISGPQERKALAAWIVEHGVDTTELVDKLPGLKQGNGWLWSPQWMRRLEEIRFLPKKTFDASKTPGRTAKSIIPGPIDLAALEKRMAETIERAKRDDPVTLRAEIARLKRELEAKPAPQIDQAKVQETVQRALDAQVRAIVWQLGKKAQGIGQAWARVSASIEEFARYVAIFEDPESAIQPPVSADDVKGILSSKPSGAGVAQPVRAPRLRAEVVGSKPSPGPGDDSLGGPHRKLLTVLAQARAQGLTASKRYLALRAGYAINGGAFNNPLGNLRSREYLEGTNEDLRITDAGVRALGDYESLPSGRALLEYWLGHLDGPAAAILRVIAERFPESFDNKNEVAEAVGKEPSGGAFNNPLGKLRTLQLIQGYGPIRASEELFG